MRRSGVPMSWAQVIMSIAPFDARIVYRRVTNTIKLYAKQRRLVQMVSEQIRAREIIRICWWVY